LNTPDLLEQKKESGAPGTPHFFGSERIPALETHTPVAGIDLRSGDVCPQCQIERLDYDGLLNLTCPGCGFSPSGGCFS
jgi:hypothetical protein